ncbi:MAG: hypothetical protein IT320_23060 [Anaerolineae bacterium]|nr:hypothetical protein [Anaerolineae bacterium]
MIPSQHPGPPHFDDHSATIETRRLLYQLIAMLRRNARHANSVDNKALFDTSAEVVAGLARAFRAASKPDEGKEVEDSNGC